MIFYSKNLDNHQISALESTHLLDTSQTSNKIDVKTPGDSLNHSMIQSITKPRKLSPISKYKIIETHNIKFESFLSKLLKSKLPVEKIKQEILDYVTGLETKYTQKLSEMRIRIDRERYLFSLTFIEKNAFLRTAKK